MTPGGRGLAALAAEYGAEGLGVVAGVDPAEVPGLLGEMETLRAALWARLQAAAPVPAAGPGDADRGRQEDRLLTAEQAAERLGVSRRWVYRHAPTLPFSRRLSGGTLRFSSRGLDRWQASRGRRPE